MKLLARPEELQPEEKRPTSIGGARNLIYEQGVITEKRQEMSLLPLRQKLRAWQKTVNTAEFIKVAGFYTVIMNPEIAII